MFKSTSTFMSVVCEQHASSLLQMEHPIAVPVAVPVANSIGQNDNVVPDVEQVIKNFNTLNLVALQSETPTDEEQLSETVAKDAQMPVAKKSKLRSLIALQRQQATVAKDAQRPVDEQNPWNYLENPLVDLPGAQPTVDKKLSETGNEQVSAVPRHRLPFHQLWGTNGQLIDSQLTEVHGRQQDYVTDAQMKAEEQNGATRAAVQVGSVVCMGGLYCYKQQNNNMNEGGNQERAGDYQKRDDNYQERDDDYHEHDDDVPEHRRHL